MKKKLFIVLILIIIVCSCGNKKKEEKNPNEITMSGIKYVIDKDDSSYNIKYKVASNFERKSLISCVSYYSEKVNDEYNFIIRIFNYDKKYTYESIVNDIAGSKLDIEDVIVNDVEYKLAIYKIEDDEIDIYIKKVGKEYYAFVFLAKDDVDKLESVFLKGIIFEE